MLKRLESNEREQVMIFAGVCAWFVAGYVWAVTSCPLPATASEAWQIFALQVAFTIGPAYTFMRVARWLQTR